MMYRPFAYAIDDPAVLRAAMRKLSFATIAAAVRGRVQFAYAPIVVDRQPSPRGGARFHLSRANPFAELNGEEVRISLVGPNAYVSPDWYETQRLVPTWNYVAVEGTGRARRLDDGELLQMLIDLSKEQEERLLPKSPWTIEKIPGDRITALLRGIRGFSVAFDTLEGKFKLSQDKASQDVAGVIAGLESRGDGESRAVAAAMRSNGRVTGP
ncbi:MAG TPA: FMN-binding negative transcriptional regulator [Rhizomicrobium sp.]|jgi:transcriptional regulator